MEVLQNSIAENNEIFAVVLTNPVYATLQDLQTSLTMLGVIEDDEPTVTVEARHPAVEEGDDVVLDLTRSGDTTGELTVWLWVSQTAPHALTRQDAVVFAAGNATAEHVIPTQDDSVRLGSYTVNASLLNPATVGKPRTYRLGSPSAAAATVRDNELSPVSLNTTNLRVIEGETITLELSRRWGTGTALTVNLSITETGQFTTGALPTSVTFGQLVDTRTIRIQTADDRTAEDIGKLTVTLNDGTGYRAAWPNTHTFTVYDNDGAKPFVSVSADHDWVNEGEPVSFTVTRSGPTGNIMEARVRLTRVRYRVTAEDLSDPSRGITSPPSHVHFGKEELTLEFPAGTRTLTITRPTTDDNLNYGNSTYHALILNDPSDEYVAPYSQSAKVWVQDDDIPTVTGTSTLSEHNEGYNRVVIPFSRTGDVSGALELKSRITFTEFIPEPGQDITVTEPHTLVYSIQPGDASGLPVLTYGGVYFMGDGGHVQLLSHYCPGRPNACGYFPQYVVGNPSDITYRVYSDIMGVRIEADQVSVDEGEPATFTFHRLGGKPDSLTRSLQVNVLVSQEGGYISGGAPQTVTFAANEATTTLSIPTAEDMVDEADGSITVEILRSYERGDGDDRYGDDRYHYESNEYPGTPWEIYAATTVVTDDDYVPPTISISDASALETDRTISFTVSLDSANTERAATVDWATAEDGSTTAATSDVDYTAASGALDFAIGETEKTITVALLDDELDEDNETFSVILSNPSEVILGDGTGSGAINDNELAFAVVWHSSTWHTEEGDDIVITFRRLVPLDPDGVVTTEDDCYKGRAASCFNSDLNADPGNLPLTINLAVTLEGDYFSGTAPASVTFPPGESLVNLLIPTVDDSNVEAKGTAIVQILQGSGYSPLLTGDFPGIVVPTRPHHVYDNDLTIAIDDAQADESSGQLDFTVRLNEAAPEQVTVDVATIDGEATSHANVTATSLGRDFHAKTETITFEAGEQQKTFSVALVDDKIHERDETLSAQLSIPPQSRNRYRINFSIYHGTLEQWPPITSLADGTGEGTIVDDEQPMAASVSRSYDVVNENQAGPVRFMVELSHADTTANERNVAVGWQVVAGTATEGEDYLAADGMLNFPVGSNTGALEVDLVDDHLFEKELETFTVELIDQGTRLATISPTGNSFVTSIRDNETLTASIMADALSVVEGGTAGFTVRLTGGVTQEDVQITFETGGDATGGSDYDAPLGNLTLPPGDNTGSAGTLTIPAGQKSGTITYPIKTDNIAEEDGETLEVQLFTVNDGLRSSGVSGSENIASTTILDGDSLIVSIQGNPTVAEGGTATFSVRLSETEAEDVSVEWATTQPGNPLGAGETAEPDLDYTADSGTVAIPAGSTSATFTVATNQDTLVEGDETFVVTLEQATKGTAQPPELLTLGVTMATGTITDDDTAPTGVTLSAVPDSVTEDAGATDISATVSLDGTAQFTHDTPVTIEFADRPGNPRNAIPGVDYTAAPVNTVIPAGESGVTAIITITPVDDNMEENDEIARLEAGSPDLSGTDALGVNITDNDTAVVEVELTATPGAVDETVSSTILTVTAALVGSSSRAIDTVINLSATDGTAESAEDYEFTDTTVTIPAGAMSATVSVSLTVLDDTLAEGDETFEIGGSITAASITVLPAEITIRDDDTEPTGIALSYSAAPLDEGGSPASIDLEASLLGGGTRTTATQVSLRVVDLTTTTNDDYTASWYTLTLSIPAGEYSATAVLTITPVDDNLHEGTEQLAVRAANSDPGLAVNGVRIPILDDDPQPTTITLSLSHATLSEQVKTWWVNVTATLEGASTLATDTVITTQLDPQGIARNTYGGILKSELRIEAGQSTSTAEMLLTNIDDQVDDADETLVIGGTVSDPSLTVTPASLVITDDDTYGVTIWPTTLSVREGRRNNYNVKLDTEPTATVTVTIDLPADAGFTVNPGTLTFTPQSWGTKYVIVSGTQDEDAADEAAATITHSIITTDELYRNAATSDVSITVRDDETAGVTFSTTTLEVAEGQDATYTVVLDTVPVGDVTVTIGGVTGTDLSLDKTTLTFTTIDWDAAQTVTVTAGRDGDTADDTATLTHTVASTADSAYDGAPADSIAVTVTDDVSAGVTISESSLDIEEGDSDTYTVALDTRPTGDVTVSISGHTGTDVSLDKATLTFTAQDWNVEQEVTVTAEQDGDSQDEAAVTLSHTVSSAVDTDYDGISTGSMEVSISDDDEDGVTIYPTEVTVTEGQTATYTVVLDSQPTGDVTVTVKDPTDNTAVTADPARLTFTTADWDDAQEVTVSAAQDDDDQDGSATVTHEVASTGDASYDGIAAPDVGVTLEDDAPETVTVNFKESSYDTDEGSAVAVALTLDLDPERTVTVPLTHAGQNGAGADDYSGVPATVVFNSGETEKSFTFSATDDTVDDDDESVLIGFGALPADVTAGNTDEATVSINDDDVPAVAVSFEQSTYDVAEGSSVTVKVKLDADPERTVTIPLTMQDREEPATPTTPVSRPTSHSTLGETENTFSFSATADEDDDDDESVKLGFGNVLPTGVSAGTTNESIVSITDDDVPAVTVSFEHATYTVPRGAASASRSSWTRTRNARSLFPSPTRTRAGHPAPTTLECLAM